MNPKKATNATFHACCMGTEMGLMAEATGPQKESLRLIQGPLEVERIGAAALGEELRRIVVGDGFSMALHRRDIDHPRQVHP